MRSLSKLIGLILLLVGIYILGQNIIFTTQTAGYWWRGMSAGASVLATLSGILLLIYGGRSVREAGWILIGVGIVMVFVSGGVVLRPTNLWTFIVSFSLLVGGFQLLTRGRLNL